MSAVARLPPRARRLSALVEEPPRVLVVGGGITGAGIALDLALRGVRTALFERGDWGCGTSSASSRLIHGGLRYLEQYAFGLVRESCRERARLLDNAAGMVWPERFHFPLLSGGVSRPKLAAGLLLYAAVSLPRPLGFPRLAGARALAERVPGIERLGLRGAGVYLDAATHDARLTLAVALSAQAAGATIVSRCELSALENGARGVAARLLDRVSGTELEIQADAAVLAGGPFIDLLRGRAGLGGAPWVAPTRGSHVLVPRERLPTDGAVIFPSPIDRRVMFLIPWPRYTVIGTTDLDADPALPSRATRAEVRYLLDSANGLVPRAELGEGDVVSTWSGLRPLLASGADPSQRSREERIEAEGRILSIAGGKLTGYRAMAEKAAHALCSLLGEPGPRASPTRAHRLVGALERRAERPAWSSLASDGRARLGPEPLVHAWSRRYAARAGDVRDLVTGLRDGLRPLDAETLLGEVDWAVAAEDALGPGDFALRRTDLGYGEAADAALPLVAARMEELLGWDAKAGALARAEAQQELDLRRAWKRDPRP
jgi:glycerol-3-phosphate dehydrogenase